MKWSGISGQSLHEIGAALIADQIFAVHLLSTRDRALHYTFGSPQKTEEIVR
jgi:hypothetical protein